MIFGNCLYPGAGLNISGSFTYRKTKIPFFRRSLRLTPTSAFRLAGGLINLNRRQGFQPLTGLVSENKIIPAATAAFNDSAFPFLLMDIFSEAK